MVVRDVAETGTFGFVLAACGWIAYQLRRVTIDTESRAGRTIEGLEEEITELRAEVGQVQHELALCHAEHAIKDRRLARMERALILEGIPIPD